MVVLANENPALDRNGEGASTKYPSPNTNLYSSSKVTFVNQGDRALQLASLMVPPEGGILFFPTVS